MTARDFTPTDEQVEDLARYVRDPMQPDLYDDRPQDQDWWQEQAQYLIESPAFQSIIAAAKAEALRDLADEMSKADGGHGYEVWASGAADVLRKRADEISEASA